MPRLLAALLLAAVLAVAPAAAADQPVSLPRDHGAHGSSIEWWYFTAFVRDPHGHAVLRLLHALREQRLRPARGPGAEPEHGKAHRAQREHEPLRPRRRAGPRRRHPRLAPPLRRHVRHLAVHRQPAGPSRHAQPARDEAVRPPRRGRRDPRSRSPARRTTTRPRACARAGTLRVDGKQVPITGESWFDHQWGGFRERPARVQLELVLVPVRRRARADALPVPRPRDRPAAHRATQPGPSSTATGGARPSTRFTATPRGEELTAAGQQLAARLAAAGAVARTSPSSLVVACARPARTKRARADLLGGRSVARAARTAAPASSRTRAVD